MENDNPVAAPIDENINQPVAQPTYASTTTNGFTNDDNKKDKRGFLLVLITISVLIIIGGVVFFFSQREIANEETESVLPAAEEFIEEPTIEPIATTKPIDVSLLKVKVMNGTGIAKEASYVESLLIPLGFKNIEKTNATTTDYVNTEVSFSAEVAAEIKTAVITALEKAYKNVVTKTLTGSTYNIEIITGAKLTTTASTTPKASVTPKPSVSPTASPKASATPTATPAI